MFYLFFITWRKLIELKPLNPALIALEGVEINCFSGRVITLALVALIFSQLLGKLIDKRTIHHQTDTDRKQEINYVLIGDAN